MKCPLSFRSMYSNEPEPKIYGGDCLEAECAWWVVVSQSCAMEAIPRIIGYVGSEVEAIEAKMPHEGQFRT